MNMLELIELIDGLKGRAVIYHVHRESLFDFKFVEGNDYVFPLDEEFKTFTDAEEIIPYLFDLDLFGWQLKAWNVEERWTSISTMDIKLFRMEEQQ